MKLLRPRSFVIFALAGLSGAVLLHTSQEVQQTEERLHEMEYSMQQEREKLQLLRAEWASLNRPERLEHLAQEFLDLAPPQPDQLLNQASSLPQIPEEAPLMNEDEGPGILQPVAFDPPKAAPAPAPPAKPEKAAPPSAPKGFDELLKELEKNP